MCVFPLLYSPYVRGSIHCWLGSEQAITASSAPKVIKEFAVSPSHSRIQSYIRRTLVWISWRIQMSTQWWYLVRLTLRLYSVELEEASSAVGTTTSPRRIKQYTTSETRDYIIKLIQNFQFWSSSQVAAPFCTHLIPDIKGNWNSEAVKFISLCYLLTKSGVFHENLQKQLGNSCFWPSCCHKYMFWLIHGILNNSFITTTN